MSKEPLRPDMVASLKNAFSDIWVTLTFDTEDQDLNALADAAYEIYLVLSRATTGTIDTSGMYPIYYGPNPLRTTLIESFEQIFNGREIVNEE